MRTYRAAPSTYFTFAVVTGTIALLWGIAVWRVDAPLLPIFVPLAGFLTVALWLSRFRVTLSGERVEVALPFRRRSRLERHEILSVEFAERTSPLESPMTLCIRTSEGRELRLNAKVFSPHAIQELLALGQPARKG